MTAAKRVPLTFTIIQGVEGPSLYLNGFRVAGPKPWGGGKVLYEWTVEGEDLLAALNHSTKIAGAVAARALSGLRTKTLDALKRIKAKTERKGVAHAHDRKSR